MKREHSRWQAMPAPALGWTEAGIPHCGHFDDVYYSRDNGMAESRYVFLEGNQLPQRWAEHPRDSFVIGETGFGTGLNFLLSWQAWRQAERPKPGLHYVSLEQFPLSPVQLALALEPWGELADLAQELIAVYPEPIPGQHRLVLEAGEVVLDLWWEEAGTALEDLASAQLRCFDAWYLDGFAPSRNAAMWRPPLLQAVAALSHEGATFATFTAAGQVRRDLKQAGFETRNRAGYGRKRECLQGRVKQQQPRRLPEGSPWDLCAAPLPKPATALVIGAGLAGCTAAAALARRGLAVYLLEQDTVAAAGSGNTQGVLYTRLSRKHSPLADFALQSFGFANRFYRQLLASGMLDAADGALCGSFHQSDRADELAQMGRQLESLPGLARVVTAAEASALCGVEQPLGGYWFPGSGWMNPAAVCRSLAATPGVRLHEHCGALRLVHARDGWRALAGDTLVATADCAVIATGTATTNLVDLHWLPLQAIRGQTTNLPSGKPFCELRTVLCHDGYIAPTQHDHHCIGASFNLGDHNPAPAIADQHHNLQHLAAAVPAWSDALQALEQTALGGRVGFRCASPDYLPLVGPVPALAQFLQNFAALRDNARRPIASWGDYMPGLYLSTGHGSRGLTATPLSAELLASQICNEPPPVCRGLSRALAPARFLIRQLGRNQL